MTPPTGLSERLAQRVADTMFALSTPSRLQILAYLRDGPRTVSEIVAAVGMEQSAVSHQLRVLRDHAVLNVQRSGRRRHYSLRDEHVGELLEDALRHVRELDGSDAERADEVGGNPLAVDPRSRDSSMGRAAS